MSALPSVAIGVRVCRTCSTPLTPANTWPSDWRRGQNRCAPCGRKRVRAWQSANRPLARAASTRWKVKHMPEQRAYVTKCARMRRLRVLQHYSDREDPVCACCPENRLEFLTVDHADNDGAKRKREEGVPTGGTSLIAWLVRHRYPPGFQVLCWNCNEAKAHYGVCPHVRERANAAAIG